MWDGKHVRLRCNNGLLGEGRLDAGGCGSGADPRDVVGDVDGGI
jgi:hypothetical protein